jgi:hypothetical protein
LNIQGRGSKTSKLNIDPVYIGSQNNSQSLITDEQNHVLAAYGLTGAGKIILTTLNSTYNWMLSGNSDDYALIWSLLISKAARNVPPSGNVSLVDPIPSVNNKLDIQIVSANKSTEILVNNVPTVPLQEADLPFINNISFWPEHAGWQQMKLTDTELHHWYAYAEDDWRGLKALKNISDTRAYAIANPVTSSVTKQIHQTEHIEVPKIYFYLVLLAALTFLWVEAKFSA